MKSDLQAAFSLSAMTPQNKNSMTTLTGNYFRLCSRAHSDENKMLLVEFFLRSLGAERCTYARDLDLEGAHAFAHHSFEVYLQPSKAARASKMTLREPTKKRANSIEVRWATRNNYLKTVYQFGTLNLAARPSTNCESERQPRMSFSTLITSSAVACHRSSACHPVLGVSLHKPFLHLRSTYHKELSREQTLVSRLNI